MKRAFPKIRTLLAFALLVASASWGARQRFLAAIEQVRDAWPLIDGPPRWRLGEVTVDWAAVAPTTPG